MRGESEGGGGEESELSFDAVRCSSMQFEPVRYLVTVQVYDRVVTETAAREADLFELRGILEAPGKHGDTGRAKQRILIEVKHLRVEGEGEGVKG